ncbi:MAG: DUF4245 family protein [Frankiales bacterium]|nr:DUF4245 family protein [Frankiales bacterium]
MGSDRDESVTDVAPPSAEGDSAPVGAGPTPAGDDPAEVARQREERARKRLRQTARDMFLSMLVVSGVVVLLVLPWNRGSDTIATVDPSPVVAGARETEPWPVLAPTGEPATWRCTSARISTAVDGQDIVHLGYLTPDSLYMGLEQSATQQLSFVSDQTLQGREDGTVRIGDRTWTRMVSADGTHRSLVTKDSGATYVVLSTASWDVVTAFTASLRAG